MEAGSSLLRFELVVGVAFLRFARALVGCELRLAGVLRLVLDAGSSGWRLDLVRGVLATVGA